MPDSEQISATLLGDRFLLGPILLLGAPGAGKGTQARLIAASFDVPQISTGDLLRHHVQMGTELGRIAKASMDEGQLVCDDIVNGMVADRLAAADTKSGYVLDGFPRTGMQAAWLDQTLEELRCLLPLIAVRIDLPREGLLQRITGRRTCPRCASIYNVFLNPSRVPGVCDLDGVSLSQRSDDTAEAFSERMLEYESKTAPVIEHYRGLGRFREIDGSGSPAQIEASILAAICELRPASLPFTVGERV